VKRTFSRLVLHALLAAAVSACSPGNPRCARIPGGGTYCLQASAAVPPFEVQQKIEFTFNGRRETMIVELEVDADGMRFAGLTPFGQKLVQASFDNREVRAAVLPDKRLDPALLLALLQLALWPADSVRAGLGTAVVVEESTGQRRVLDNGNLVMEVDYTGDRLSNSGMRIVFPAVQLEFAVTTLDSELTK
jgi:hypothetical protein